MPIQVIPYTPDWKSRWDEFVLSSNNGTLFHLQTFLEYHPASRFRWHHLIFLQNKRIVALLPGAAMGSTFESPIGASYGSFVTGNIPFSIALEIVDRFSDYCRSARFERALLTGSPFIYHETISQNLDYALAYRDFHFDKHYLSHAIRLGNPDFLHSFQSTSRRYVRKYLREHSLQISLSDDYDAFYPILVKNKQRHGVTPTHTLDELKKLRKLLPDRLFLFLVHRGGRPIAGSLVFACNPRVALCFYNMLLYEEEKHHPIHAVMYEVIRWATENGFSWVDTGVSQDTSAENRMTPSMTLVDFKEKFGARGILRSTYYKRFL